MNELYLIVLVLGYALGRIHEDIRWGGYVRPEQRVPCECDECIERRRES